MPPPPCRSRITKFITPLDRCIRTVTDSWGVPEERAREICIEYFHADPVEQVRREEAARLKKLHEQMFRERQQQRAEEQANRANLSRLWRTEEK